MRSQHLHWPAWEAPGSFRTYVRNPRLVIWNLNQNLGLLYDIIDLIVVETNRYAAQLMTIPNLAPRSRSRQWVPITAAELWRFLAILMLQSLVSIAVEKEYWYPRKPYLKIGNFSHLMRFKRFSLIKRCLHFVDNNKLPGAPVRLDKIKPILNHLNKKIYSLYVPEQEIVINESLLWKGNLSVAQLITNKAAQVGIKIYELWESKTGYLWSRLFRQIYKRIHDHRILSTRRAHIKNSI